MTATQIYSALLIFMEYQLENVSFYTGKGINHSDVLNKLCITLIKYIFDCLPNKNIQIENFLFFQTYLKVNFN